MKQQKPKWEKWFEWTFEDYRNKNSLAYMVPTIGDVRKLKKAVQSMRNDIFEAVEKLIGEYDLVEKGMFYMTKEQNIGKNSLRAKQRQVLQTIKKDL